ncbi:DUF2339 domain-containing protein [Evansella tamaricis]|uniref:DUF2339 domain-containing protein n=1 Tax=Evansella tamaricis TaxID=2069301 RepID=A0ABS6JJR0_9BACI|nr:DUF2339 domain-containing protein [Evansella tamaricis]MBU9713892.1 DUF2339 domain-containing protein [Evansella tamaricis]
MDEFKYHLKELSNKQANITKDLDALLKEYDSHDFLRENQELRQKYEEHKRVIHQLKEKQNILESENGKLRYALQEQIIDEKLNILKVSKEKLNTYFSNVNNSHQNQLEQWEEDSRRKISRLKDTANKKLHEDKQELNYQLTQISENLNEKIRAHEEEQALRERELLSAMSEQYTEFTEEEVSEDVIQKRIKQNQMEMKIGLNWINKLGILLIILGVGAAFRYSYANWFNDYFKGAAFFLLGVLMLLAGEYFYRKLKRTFAFGLLGGGIAVLYGSIFFSYFLLEIIGLYSALIMSVLVTITAVVLSIRYHSKTICSFGLVGGYLPLYSYILAFGLEGTAVYIAMGYLILLNLSILLIASEKHWTVVHYISFLFNIPSMLVLILLSSSDLISMVYSFLTFLLYLGITLAYSFKHKVSLKNLDVVLLAFNTFISCTVMYFLFNQLLWDDYRGLLALLFSVLYFGLGQLTTRLLPKEKQTILLFYGTALTFTVLMIPFQFAIEWIALGWLIEAVVIILLANRAKLRTLEKAGWLIFFLCLGTFYMEVYGFWGGEWPLSQHFNSKYFAIMFGMMLLTMYYVKNRLNVQEVVFLGYPNFIRHFKYFSLVNLWFYLVYKARFFYYEWVPSTFSQFSFYELMMLAFLTISLAYGLTKVSVLYDRIVKYYCLFLYGFGTLLGIVVTVSISTLNPIYGQNTIVEYLALALLMAFNILVFFSGRDLLLAFIRQQFKNMEFYPLLLAIYLLGIMAAFLHVQFHLGDVSLVFTSAYLLLAISYIFYGFRKRFVYIRRLGLGLTILCTGKLILYDLSFLTEGSKIIAYFSFGVALLGISYMYQKVSSNQGEGTQVRM